MSHPHEADALTHLRALTAEPLRMWRNGPTARCVCCVYCMEPLQHHDDRCVWQAAKTFVDQLDHGSPPTQEP